MYANIADAKKNIQTATISGTIGAESFDGSNILRGSFNVTNQSCDTSTFNYGGVYIGELSATFMGLSIPRNSWVGLEITPTVTIGEDDIPLGVYIVNSVEHSGNRDSVKAYDRMSLFDKDASVTQGSYGTPYSFLALACQECGVPLGMTQAEVELLPNGNMPLVIGMIGDIQTWRDVLYWVSVTVGGFCTMNRSGELELRTYHTDADDSIPATVRFNGSQYGDEVVKYTGLSVGVADAEFPEYYFNEPDVEYTLDLGVNPFFQTTKASRAVFMNNLLTVLGNIEYVPCGVEIPFGFHYDLGDILNFPNGNGSATNKFCVMYYSWNLNGHCQIKSIPTPSKAMSKTDKDLQTAMSTTRKDEVAFYETKNTGVIHIGSGETEKLVSVRMISNQDTKACIQIEVDLKSTAITPTAEYQVDEDGIIRLEDIWQGISDTATQGIVTYLVNSAAAEIHPTETWIDGDHVMHLMYVLGLNSGITTSFDVYMKAQGGDIDIDRGGVWLYATGVGLAGDGKWDGAITCEEEASDWTIPEIGVHGSGDAVNIGFLTPVGISLSDVSSEFDLVEIGFISHGDNCSVELRTFSFPRGTHNGDIRATHNGDIRYTEGDLT